MLDLETMGVGTHPAITEIAAVAFDRETGKTLDEFHVGVDLQSSVDVGLEVSASTVNFWMNQDGIARDSFCFSQDSAIPIGDALVGFHHWISSLMLGNDIRIWGNGIMADNVWLESAYEKTGIANPIRYWQHNDVRTVVDMAWMFRLPNYKKLEEFEGVKHNPMDDCKHQIKYLVKYLNKMKGE